MTRENITQKFKSLEQDQTSNRNGSGTLYCHILNFEVTPTSKFKIYNMIQRKDELHLNICISATLNVLKNPAFIYRMLVRGVASPK